MILLPKRGVFEMMPSSQDSTRSSTPPEQPGVVVRSLNRSELVYVMRRRLEREGVSPEEAQRQALEKYSRQK